MKARRDHEGFLFVPHTPYHSPKDQVEYLDLDDDHHEGDDHHHEGDDHHHEGEDHHHEGEDDKDAETDLCRNDQVDNNPQPIVVVSHVLKVNNNLTNQDQINWSVNKSIRCQITFSVFSEKATPSPLKKSIENALKVNVQRMHEIVSKKVKRPF